MMFAFYCLILLVLVYLAPALAVYPRLILSSRTAVAVPFISIAVIIIAQALLAATGSYTHLVVIGLSLAFLLVAIVRLSQLYKQRASFTLDWPTPHRFLLLLSLLFGLYWAAKLGSTSFDNDDEIYSWNLWALQHYRSEAIDFYYTGTYPQLFAILISYCYQLLGDIELQLPAKALFALFPASLLGAIAVAPKEASASNALRSVVLISLLFVAIGQFLGVGLADPLMTCSLIMAIFLFMQYAAHPQQRELLILSVACAAVAIYTKQAALIWAVFSLPAIALLALWKRKLPAATLVAAGSLLLLAVLWIVFPGNGFQHNQGVIDASREGRGTVEQLWFAISKFSLAQPLVPLLIAAGIAATLRARQHRDIMALFLLPTLLAWLLYGAYDLRLGIHVVALAALLIAASNYNLPWLNRALPERAEQLLRRGSWAGLALAAIVLSNLALNQINKNMRLYGGQFSLYTGGQNTLAKFFGRDAGFVYKELYNRPDLLLWVPVNYIYGIFYAHTPMMRPDLQKNPKYNAAMLLEDLNQRRPDYLFDGGQWVDYTIASGVLRELAEQRCPDLFEKVLRRNKYGYVTYRLNKDDALFEHCRNTLQAAPQS
jgi:hypothetical protein